MLDDIKDDCPARLGLSSAPNKPRPGQAGLSKYAAWTDFIGPGCFLGKT